MAGGNLLISNAASSGQQMVRGITARLQHRLRSGGRPVQYDELPRRVDRSVSTAARETYAVLTGRVASDHQPGRARRCHRQVRRARAEHARRGHTGCTARSLQDSWRVKPTLTLTGRLRYDIQTPFTPSSNVMSAVTMASICGRSGLGDGGTYSRCNFLITGRSRRRRAGVHPARRGHRRATRRT